MIPRMQRSNSLVCWELNERVSKRPTRPISVQITVQLMQPLLSALPLEVLFDPDVLSERTRGKVAERLFEALMDP